MSMLEENDAIATDSAAETRAVAVRLAERLPQSLVAILLIGPLGSGKTTFVQGLAEGLGIMEVVASPSFLLMKDYTTGSRPMRHIDLFRLDSPQKVPSLGLTEDLPDNAVVAVEWADQFRLPISAPQLTVAFAHGTRENGRKLTFSAENNTTDSELLDAMRSS